MAGHPRGGGRGTPVAVPPPLQRALLSCLQPPGWSGAQAAPRISSRIVAASTAPADAAGVESVPDAPPPPSADEVAQAAKKHNRCVAYIDYALARSPFVKFMTRALEQAGCPFSREHFICEPCDNRNLAGGFVPTAGVVLCENHSLSQSDVNDVVTHELIHAFDHCRAKVDWDDCVHHACSEIRAANLSGDCFFGKELMRGFYGIAKHQQECVRRRAILSVRQNKNCSAPGAAEAAVDAAFPTCFADTAPFERIP